MSRAKLLANGCQTVADNPLIVISGSQSHTSLDLLCTALSLSTRLNNFEYFIKTHIEQKPCFPADSVIYSVMLEYTIFTCLGPPCSYKRHKITSACSHQHLQHQPSKIKFCMQYKLSMNVLQSLIYYPRYSVRSLKAFGDKHPARRTQLLSQT